ncbi:MAG TPA: MetQ/NlpA family ABC transporter substrate-binding protein [Caulobacteraceae bacterium]|jgi:D-methionine transport system substrate-binding protein|nr:MetQ/NlpA family ABC transporter substrate-binding protein [Caulobacteraceae bacterium]
MRRRLILAFGLAAALAACSRGGSQSAPAHILRVAATAEPHAEILEAIKPDLAAKGVTLEVKVFNDYVQPNIEVDQKQLDLNYFQTLPYLDQFNRDHGTHLIPIVGVHIEPLGAYSLRYKNLAALPAGAEVAIPNEASNEGRALLLLQRAGLIKLTRPADPLSTLKDVVANPKGIRIRELEGALLPRTLDQVDLALINTNYALNAKLDPTRDALFIEDSHSPYVNYLVGRPDNKDNADVRALAAALTSPRVKAFIAQRYHGAVVAAF